MRHKEDAVPLPGLRTQKQRNRSVPKRGTKEAVYLKDRQILSPGSHSGISLKTYFLYSMSHANYIPTISHSVQPENQQYVFRNGGKTR